MHKPHLKSHQRYFFIGFTVLALCMVAAGCGGTYEFRVQQVPEIEIDQKFKDDISLTVSTEAVYHHSVGINDYQIYLEEGVKKEYQKHLSQCFTGGVKPKPANINNNVVLPTPFGPTSPILPSFGMLTEILVNISFGPKDWLSWVAVKMAMVDQRLYLICSQPEQKGV